jgi:ferredoxin
MKVSIDSGACTGHGLCYALAPVPFADDDQGYGTVIADGTVPPERADAARKPPPTVP